MSATVRIDMSLVDEKVLAYIRNSPNKHLTYFVIAHDVGCSPMTARRSVKRLESAGKLTLHAPQGRVFFFSVNDEGGQP